MGKFDITAAEQLSLKWKVVDADGVIDGRGVEDISIFTIDDREVIGCSEWMRADIEVFNHIVNLHNDFVDLNNRKGE